MNLKKFYSSVIVLNKISSAIGFSVFMQLLIAFSSSAQAPQTKDHNERLFYDSHLHLTNYIQEGIDVHKFLEIMGTKVGRSTLFGIPLHQQCSYGKLFSQKDINDKCCRCNN